MSGVAPPPDWLARLQAAAAQPPRKPREPLWAGSALIGSVEPDFPKRIGQQSAPTVREVLQKTERDGVTGWQLHGDPTAALGLIAFAMRDAGLAGAWRDEQLAVADENGVRVGTVERAAVRPLGIATHAVHLAARSPDGRHWVQQRALTKANDPGLWDTLMGGLVSAADSLEQALERETWEEAGLRVPQLQGVRRGGLIPTRRPSADGGGAGYVVEHIAWFECVLPAAVAPDNQDGEVSQFALLRPQEVLARLVAGEFTLEAALVLCAAGL
ncbi:MAG: NUDIX domain-containing protein [Burkholderiales bacterium]|nr:NUDIX domain-containing protein [Burkholderiales bacterium]